LFLYYITNFIIVQDFLHDLHGLHYLHGIQATKDTKIYSQIFSTYYTF